MVPGRMSLVRGKRGGRSLLAFWAVAVRKLSNHVARGFSSRDGRRLFGGINSLFLLIIS